MGCGGTGFSRVAARCLQPAEKRTAVSANPSTSLLVRDIFLESHLEPKLKLTRIESLSRYSKTRTGAECIDRHSEICAIQNVETFREKLKINSLRKFEPSAHTQIKRSVVKTSSSVSSHTDGTIVVITVEVTILSEQHVKRQTRSVGKDVTELKTTQRPLESIRLSLLRRLDRTTHDETVALIVVRQAAIVANVEVVLNVREEEADGVVDRFRERIRHTDVGPTRSTLVE